MKYDYHEIANIFPMMNEDEYDRLKDDIAINGQLEPVVLYEGKVLDGRNRYKALCDIGLKTNFEEYQGDQPLSYVISKNLHRRHLEVGQRAMIATTVKPMLEVEAKKRQAHGLTAPGKSLLETFPEAIQGNARDQAGDLFGVSGKSVATAEMLKEEAPDLAEKVMSGEMTLNRAAKTHQKTKRLEVDKLPSDKYRVIYADPPWDYGPDYQPQYGHVSWHYPSMKLEDICALNVKELADENAVLFIWCTSPMLKKVFKVIEAWGFEYKTSFVWDKVGHNFGHYNSVRHEFLLVCTKGSCTPDNLKLFDSVQSIEKTSNHSEKPEEFRNIIDTLYTFGKKIELFARVNQSGWEAWGNEPGLYTSEN